MLKDIVGVGAAPGTTSAEPPEPERAGERRGWWRRVSYPYIVLQQHWTIGHYDSTTAYFPTDKSEPWDEG